MNANVKVVRQVVVLGAMVVMTLLVGCGKEENDGTATEVSTDHVIPVEKDGPDVPPVSWIDYNINNVPIAPGLKEVKAKHNILDHPFVKALERPVHVDPFYFERDSKMREMPSYSFRQFSTEKDMMSILRWYRSNFRKKEPKPGGMSLNGPFYDGCVAKLNANNFGNHIEVIGIKDLKAGKVTIYLFHYTK